MRRVMGRLLLLGAAAGGALAVRNYLLRSYLEGSARAKQGDVQIVLKGGATVEPGSEEVQEFADIARRILEIEGQSR